MNALSSPLDRAFFCGLNTACPNFFVTRLEPDKDSLQPQQSYSRPFSFRTSAALQTRHASPDTRIRIPHAFLF